MLPGNLRDAETWTMPVLVQLSVSPNTDVTAMAGTNRWAGLLSVPPPCDFWSEGDKDVLSVSCRWLPQLWGLWHWDLSLTVGWVWQVDVSEAARGEIQCIETKCLQMKKT